MSRYHVRYCKPNGPSTIFWIDATETNARYEYTFRGTSPDFEVQCRKLKIRGGVMVEAKPAEPDNNWMLDIVLRALKELSRE